MRVSNPATAEHRIELARGDDGVGGQRLREPNNRLATSRPRRLHRWRRSGTYSVEGKILE